MKVNFLIVSFLILFCTCINVSAATTDDWDVTWTPIKNSLIDKEYRIEVQNLQNVKQNVNICSFFDETNFPIYKMKDIEFYEWKLLPYNYTINHYDHINYSEYICNELNSTCYWYNRTKNILNYTEIIEFEKLGWKECKSLLFTPTLHNLKNDYGLINIPKAGSKDAGDGTYNGTKVFLLKWKTPIVNTGNRFGSSGKVAVLLDGIEYHPYWNTSFSTRKEIILTGNTSGAQTNYQILLNVTYETEMQNDFDDLRFTNDTHEIDSWLESKVNGSYALVWVEFPTTPANGVNQTYYVYYGNAGVANNWDIGATFIFGDDFSGDLSKWSQISASAAITSGVVKAYPTANYGGLKSVSSVDISSPRMMEARVRMNNVAAQMNGVGFFDRTDATAWYQHPSVFVRQFEATDHKMYGILDIEGTHYGGTVLHDPSDANWHRYKIKAEEGAYPTFWFDSSTVTIEHNVAADTYYLWAPKAYNTHSADEWTETDWIFVRKYAATPPTYIYGSIIHAETFIPPIPTSLTNTTGNFWVTHTWAAGSGNVTDGYNVSVNTIWHNTTNTFYTDTYSANAWQNITIWAYNSSCTGTMSEGNVSQNTQVPPSELVIILMISQLKDIFAAIILTVKAIFNLIIDVFPFIIAMIFLSSFAYLIGKIFGRSR